MSTKDRFKLEVVLPEGNLQGEDARKWIRNFIMDGTMPKDDGKRDLEVQRRIVKERCERLEDRCKLAGEWLLLDVIAMLKITLPELVDALREQEKRIKNLESDASAVVKLRRKKP